MSQKQNNYRIFAIAITIVYLIYIFIEVGRHHPAFHSVGLFAIILFSLSFFFGKPFLYQIAYLFLMLFQLSGIYTEI